MDGLLFDTEVIYYLEWENLARFYGQTLDPSMLAETCGSTRESMVRIVQRYWPKCNGAKIIQELFEHAHQTLSHGAPMKPGVIPLLIYLRDNGVRMAIASSSTKEMIQCQIEKADIASYFEVVISGDQVAQGKPEPDIFLLAAQNLHLKPKQCYVLEDGIQGVKAGLAAGCHVIMVPDRTITQSRLQVSDVRIYDSLYAVYEAMRKGEC